MIRKWITGAAVLVFVAALGDATTSGVAREPQQGAVMPAAAASSGAPVDEAFLKQYCVTCHSQRMKAAGLVLEGLDVSKAGDHAEVWEKVVRKLRTGLMPPSGSPRPARPVIDSFAAALEHSLDRAHGAQFNPGTTALHRLNRAEYANAIRDLLSITVDPSTALPPDDSAGGFDNIADVLGVSPAFIESYVTAAMRISRVAVGDPTIAVDRSTYRVSGDLSQEEHMDGLPLGTRGGIVFKHTFPLDAEYELQVRASARGSDLDVTIDGEHVEMPARNERRIAVKAGTRTIAVALVKRNSATGADDMWWVYSGSGGVQSVAINGPFNVTGPGDTPTRRNLFICQPASEKDELPCATKILTNFASKAFRRPVSANGPEVKTLLEFYQAGRSAGTFDTGIGRGVARVLADPQFLFRIENEPANVAAGTPYRLSDLELASRISFFLWSSIPDDELREVAAKGQLKDPAVLDQQIRRMLKDPKADAIISNFVGQWLFLRELKNVRPDSREFDGNLRQAFQKETELLVGSVIREDQSLVRLLDADYTFVDERLARHYGMPNIRGSRFRRISLPPDSPRRGLLGQGSILTVTSVANRTSPVIRGKWILENLLGAPPPVPPPGVEGLEVTTADLKNASLRARLESHRKNPVCASCHKLMDPIGFSLENFDLTGKWRETDGSSKVDASGVLVDGTKLDGPASLRNAIIDRSDVFVTVATEKLLTYAIGRVATHDDMPTVRAIVREAAKNDYRFSSLVMGVIKSAPFQMKIKRQERQG